MYIKDAVCSLIQNSKLLSEYITYHKLHSSQLMNNITTLFPYNSPGYLVIRLSCILHRSLSQIVECYNVL